MGLVRQKNKNTKASASLLQTITVSRLKVQKYKIPPRMAIIFMKMRCRPAPRERPSRKSAIPVITQNKKSVTAVTVLERVLCRTTRKKSYKNPAAAPKKREEAAWIS